MGNRQSTETTANSQIESPVEENEELLNDETSKFGIVLGNNLQASLVKDFQNQILEEEWNNRKRNLMQQTDDRVLREQEFAETFQEKREKFLSSKNQVQADLDSRLESLKANFSDEYFDSNYDIDAALKKYAGGSSSSSKQDENKPCLDARLNLTQCYNDGDKEKDSCKPLMDQLEKCVNNFLISQ